MKKTTTTTHSMTTGAVACALLGGFGLAISCIIPDQGIVVNQRCGEEWRLEATGSVGLNVDGQFTDIRVGAVFPQGAECLSPSQVAIVEAGQATGCHALDNETDCAANPDCLWLPFDYGARSVHICRPSGSEQWRGSGDGLRPALGLGQDHWAATRRHRRGGWG